MLVSILEALKAPDLTMDRNTVLHIALTSEFRLPEELSIDFEENFELSESHYGQRSLGRKTFNKFELQYSTIKWKLKEAFNLRLIDLYEHLKLSGTVFKQPNAS